MSWKNVNLYKQDDIKPEVLRSDWIILKDWHEVRDSTAVYSQQPGTVNLGSTGSPVIRGRVFLEPYKRNLPSVQ